MVHQETFLLLIFESMKLRGNDVQKRYDTPEHESAPLKEEWHSMVFTVGFGGV